MIFANINETSLGIAKYLNEWLINNKTFNLRSYYGETFTLLLLKNHDLIKKDAYSSLLSEYDLKNKSKNDFHFEFNNYAFIEYLKLNPKDELIKSKLTPVVFKGTSCTNWTLLRSNCRFKLNIDNDLANREALEKIDKFQLKSGLILDDKGVKSFQYHCFSMAMIGEIYMETKNETYLNSFKKGVEFILKFILPNGCSLYIGRGQEQSFGYGALIYILALHYKFFKKTLILSYIKKIHVYLDSFKLKQGNFPLVMNDFRKGPTQNVDLNLPEFSGWYQYNNYFDYLPFLGVFLKKAADLLCEEKFQHIKFSDLKLENYSDSSFKIIKSKNYASILSKPEGYWTNDLAIPLIYKDNDLITPIYGGDQYAEGLQNIKSLPLPFFNRFKKSIRWRSYSFYVKNNIIMVSPLGIMIRLYNFKTDFVLVSTYVISLFKVIQPFYFLKNKKIFLSKKASMIKETIVSPNGILEGMFTKGSVQKLKIHIK